MKTVQKLYQQLVEGVVTRSKFLYEVRRDENLKQFITNLTSFDDSIRILKNRGIITEAKKEVTQLTLDTANPYEYDRGLQCELGTAYQSTPQYITVEAFQSAQNKVLTNLAKDPNYYTKKIAGMKVTKSPDLASDAERGEKSSRADVYQPVKGGSMTDKKNATTAGKKDKANVKDTLGAKEKAKSKTAGVKIDGKNPKPQKKIKLKEVFNDKFEKVYDEVLNKMNGSEDTFALKQLVKTTCKKYGVDEREFEIRFPSKAFIQNNGMIAPVHTNENIPGSNTSVLPFGTVQPGMKATDDSGAMFKILAKGKYQDLKRYDSTKTFDKFLSSDPSGIDANEVVAIIDGDGRTSVRAYGVGGIYVFGNNQAEAVVVKPNTPEADPNQLKKYTDKGMDIKLDPNMKEMKLSNIAKRIIREQDADFEAAIHNKEIPISPQEMAEAKALVLPIITKANLQTKVDLDRDIALKSGNIWVKVTLGQGLLTKEMQKALTSEGNYLGANPVNNTTITLVFSKA